MTFKKQTSNIDHSNDPRQCLKCESTAFLQKHQVTYLTDISVLLCKTCRSRLIGLNARGTQVAAGDLKGRAKYTDKIRATLYTWFINNPWPEKRGTFVKRVTRAKTLEILKAAKFKIHGKAKTRRSGKVNHSVPWRHDFNNNCIKCHRAYHLQIHHITYNPELTAFLCETCHSHITGLNSRAAGIAGTSKRFKPNYTNKIRVILWRWFLQNPWPSDDDCKPLRRLSKTLIQKILRKAEFNHLKTIGKTLGKEPNESHDCISTLTLNSA